MAKNKFDHSPKPLANLAQALGDVGRVIAVNRAMKDYEFNNSVLHPSPMEYLLAQLLNVDSDWVSLFEGTYSGRLSGSMLVGAEDHPAAQLALAMICQRYGTIPHPTKNDQVIPNHPVIEQKKRWFADVGYKDK